MLHIPSLVVAGLLGVSTLVVAGRNALIRSASGDGAAARAEAVTPIRAASMMRPQPFSRPAPAREISTPVDDSAEASVMLAGLPATATDENAYHFAPHRTPMHMIETPGPMPSR